jgi:effector-binding domain-containing protein
MRTIKYLILAIVFVVILGAIVGLFLPSEIKMSRSIEVDRDSATVYKVVNSMKQFNHWSPWAEKDPDAVYTYSGPESGVGSKMTWKGNAQVDQGYQIILESSLNQMVKTELSFGSSDRQAIATVTLEEIADNKTKVHWLFEMNAGSNILKRYSGLAIEDLLAPDFELGLNKLKEHVESLPLFDYSMISIESLKATPVYAIRISKDISSDQMAEGVGLAYSKILDFLSENQLPFSGAPLVISEQEDDNSYQLIAALPVEQHLPESGTDEVLALTLPEGKVIQMIHKGSYDTLPKSYEKLNAYVFQNQLRVRGNSWESYESDPVLVAEKDLITHIYLPVE